MFNVLRMLFILLLVLDFTGCGGSSTYETPNKAPSAKASSSILNSTVTLDASASTDSDGNIVKYEWYEDDTLIGEEKVLKKSDFSKGKHTITLKVTDDKGVSSKTTTTFTIENQPPTAKIKTLSSVQEDTSFTLDGSKSNDEDGSIVKYDWYDGDTLLGSGKTFKALLSGARIHKITLKVTDDDGATSSDTVIITITDKSNPSLTNVAPVANAGADQSVQENQNVTLNGSASSDSDGNIVKYEWFEGNSLLGSGKTFTKNDFSKEKHTITLKVTDDDGATSSDTVVVNITTDITSPTATILPADNAIDVSIDSNVTITFSEDMNISTFTNGNIILSKGGINVNYTKTQNGNKLIIDPVDMFYFNANYNVTIQNVTDLAGNKISTNPTTITFATINPSLDDKVLKTGQKTCYDTNSSDDWIEIPCTSLTSDANATGQDGYYQKGVERKYLRDDNKNIVYDLQTGLAWQDNAEVALSDHDDKKTYDEAKTYCANLPLDGGGWRLPKAKELRSLVDFGRYKPSIDPIFKNTVIEETINPDSCHPNYWTIDLDPVSHGARIIEFEDGGSFWSIDTTVHSWDTLFFVRCVRTGH